MNGKDVLFLASKSEMRKRLLLQAAINFKLLSHAADERLIEFGGDFHAYVLAIARFKMDHAVLPSVLDTKDQYMFVLTADTLSYDKETNTVFGKPSSKLDAWEMIKHQRSKIIEVATACCLERKRIHKNVWVTEESKEWISLGKVEFHVPDVDKDRYLTEVDNAFHASGAMVIEGFGSNFLKDVQGSFFGILGLPLFELRENLQSMHFKF